MTGGGNMASTTTLVTGSVDSVAPVQASNRLTQYIAAFSATLGAFALGNVLAWTSPTATAIEGGELGFPVSSDEFAWVGSLLTIGAALSTLPAGFLVDKIGRKNTMFYHALPFAAGWAILAWATGVEMLYIGRIITGFCGGIFSVAAPLYIGEISEKEIRGTLGTCFQLMLVIGIEFTYVVGAFVAVQVISIISMVVPLIFAGIFFWMPETPQYYLKNNKPHEARVALQWFRGGKTAQTDIEPELKEMTYFAESVKPVPLKDTFKSRAAKRAMLVSVGLMVFQQLSGINAVIFYTQSIFEAAGSTIEPKYSTMIVGGVQLVATVVSAMIVDRLGRRILLMISFSVMAVCTLIIGIFLFFIEKEADVEHLGWIPILTMCVYFVAFSLGAGPIPWLMLGELFASEIKGTASSISAFINWMIAFLVTRFYGPLTEAINGSSTFWIFTGFLVLGFIFILVLLPETRGKTLEEIQSELGGVTNNLSNVEIPNVVEGDEKQSNRF